MSNESGSLVEAVNDLARVVIACNDKISTKSDAVRRLHLVAVKPARIAGLLGLPTKDVTSLINKMKKASGKRKEDKRG